MSRIRYIYIYATRRRLVAAGNLDVQVLAGIKEIYYLDYS